MTAIPAPDVSADDGLLARELAPGELVLWRQQAPVDALVREKALEFGVPALFVSTIGCIVVISHLGIWGASGPEVVAVAIGSIFLLIGLAIAVAGITQTIGGWQTRYALTGERLLIATGGKVRSYRPAAFRRVERTGNAERGTIWFDWYPGTNPRYLQRLTGIAHPKRVERLILSTLGPFSAAALAPVGLG